MKRFVIATVIGVLLSIFGGILISYSNYYYSLQLVSPDCYQLYTPQFNNATSTFTYSPEYFSCMRNVTQTDINLRFYASMLIVPGWTCVYAGAVAFVLSIVLMLTAMYKDVLRKHERGRR